MEAGFSCATVIRNRSMALCRNAALFDIPEAVKTFYDSDAYQAVPPFRRHEQPLRVSADRSAVICPVR